MEYEIVNLDKKIVVGVGAYTSNDDPNMGQLTMRIIPIGKVTSDLEIFDEMDSRLEFMFDNVQ